MKIKDIKLKKRHWFLIAVAGIWMFMVTMCKTEDFTLANIEEQKEVEQLHQMQSESDSLLQEVLYDIELRQKNYNDELDSLNQRIEDENLSHDEILKLEKKIRDTEILLAQEKIKRDTIVDAVVAIDIQDSTVLEIHVIEIDSIVWNITERDSVVYNITYNDSIVERTVYKIDTLYYDSEDIKKIKFKK